MDDLVGIKEEPIDEIDSRQGDNVYSPSNVSCNDKPDVAATVVFKIEEIEVKEEIFLEQEQITSTDGLFLDESLQINELTEDIDFNEGKLHGTFLSVHRNLLNLTFLTCPYMLN